jgi:hypothetical protein
MSFLDQTSDGMVQETFFPTRNSGCRRSQRILNILIWGSVREQQYHAGSHHISRRECPGLRHLLELPARFFGQH